jgi:HK97 gp10 family phage protein
MSVQITGLAELHKQLQTLPARIERNVMAGAINQGINVFRDAARKNVDSKDIRKAIRSRTVKGKPGEILREVYIKDAFYAKFLEFGTASFYTGKGKTVGGPYEIKPKSSALKIGDDYFASAVHPGVKPRPFMRPAFDVNANRALEAVKTYIRIRLPMELGMTERRTVTARMVREALDES